MQLLAEAASDADVEIAGHERPRTRGDCEPGGCNEQRPCPWVSCKFHLYLDVNPVTGALKLNFPHLEVGELEHTCVLDAADEGDRTLSEVGELINLTRERVRQVEEKLARRLHGKLREDK